MEPPFPDFEAALRPRVFLFEGDQPASCAAFDIPTAPSQLKPGVSDVATRENGSKPRSRAAPAPRGHLHLCWPKPPPHDPNTPTKLSRARQVAMQYNKKAGRSPDLSLKEPWVVASWRDRVWTTHCTAVCVLYNKDVACRP